MTSNSNRWRHLLGLQYATLHATSSWRQLQAAFLNRRLFFIHSLKWYSSHFLDANYVCTQYYGVFIKHTGLKEMDEKWLGRSYTEAVCFPLLLWKVSNKEKIHFLSVNTKNISSHVLKISSISLVLCTHENADILYTFNEIYLVFTSKK